MNHAVRAPLLGRHQPGTSLPSWAAAAVAVLFHSTPASERRRGTQWNCGADSFRGSSKRFNNYAKRFRRREAKQTLLCNVSMYAEYLFQSWRLDSDQSASSNSPSWFKGQNWRKGGKKNGFGFQESECGSYRNKRREDFEFCCNDDEEVETIFRSAFGGERFYYWSFGGDGNFRWRNSSGHANQRGSSHWRYETDYEVEDELSTESDIVSERLALGLSASGPLKLEQVKNAYRACALRWHPDRHQGSSKVAAEEKFKHCSAAYKSLCDKLAMN